MGNIKIGNNTMVKGYVGTSMISKIYEGNSLVFQYSTPTPAWEDFENFVPIIELSNDNKMYLSNYTTFNTYLTALGISDPIVGIIIKKHSRSPKKGHSSSLVTGNKNFAVSWAHIYSVRTQTHYNFSYDSATGEIISSGNVFLDARPSTDDQYAWGTPYYYGSLFHSSYYYGLIFKYDTHRTQMSPSSIKVTNNNISFSSNSYFSLN